MKHIAEAGKLALPKYHTGQLLVGSIVVTPRHSTASNGTERAIHSPWACEYGGEVRVINHRIDIFWLDVVRMSRQHTNYFLDQYEAALDEIVADCHGDLRGALRALMLANEQLERKLQRLGTELFERLGDDAPERLLH